jgi:DNA mismatch repair protein MutS
MVDIALGDSAVSSSIVLNNLEHHAALTGPNGGGKSSFMRAVLQCVLISHAYGLAPADSLVVRRFSWISSGLRLQDRPGDLSLFEAEVFFASEILARSDGIGLVLYDELFHSTNPPDGIRTAEVFLKQLWNKPTIVSIVSTHVFDLVESAPKVVKKICCNAAEVGGRIAFSYKVVPGISKISSVTEIWNRFGLELRGKSRFENGGR